MATTRLTNDMRQTIRGRILDHAFKKREEALREDEAAYGKMIYELEYPEEIRKTMSLLPESFFYKLSDFQVCIDGMYLPIILKEAVFVGESHRGRWGFVRLSSDCEIGRAGLDLLRRGQELSQERNSQKFKIRAVLDKVTTVNRLIKEWPEVEEFCKDFLVTKQTLPAVEFKKLNELLGLPPEVEAEDQNTNIIKTVDADIKLSDEMMLAA